MRCLLLGGTGFMGTHLAEKLVADGHEARLFSRNPGKFHRVAGAEFIEGEFGNIGLFREAVAGMEVVYHLASATLPKTSNDDPVYDVRSNLADTVRMLEACVEAGVGKVVFASSGGTVYGPPESVPIREGHPTEPISSYGIVKLAIEKYLGLFRHLHGLDYAALRISNPYGPFQDPAGQQGVVSVFLEKIRAGETISIWGDGGVVRDYLYVSELADALVLAAERDTTTSKIFNVGSGKGTSLSEMLSVMGEASGRTPKVEYLPARSLDVPANILDTERAERELGWSAEVELREGVGRTWAWIEATKGGSKV